jgi:hypothetical protein
MEGGTGLLASTLTLGLSHSWEISTEDGANCSIPKAEQDI